MSTMIRSTSFLAVRGARTTVTRRRTRFRWSTWKAGTVQSSTSAVVTVLPTPQKSDPWLLIHLHNLSFPHHWNHVYTYTICPSPTTEITYTLTLSVLPPPQKSRFDHLYTYTICLSHTMEITYMVTLYTMFFPHHINYIFSHFIHYLSFPHHGNQVLIILYTGLDHFLLFMFFPHHINHILDLYTLSVLPTPQKSHPWWLDTLSVLPTPWKPLNVIFPSHATEIMSLFDLV